MLLVEPAGKGNNVLGDLTGGAQRFGRAFAVAGQRAGHGQLAKHALGFGVGFGGAGEVLRGQRVVLVVESGVARLD